MIFFFLLFSLCMNKWACWQSQMMLSSTPARDDSCKPAQMSSLQVPYARPVRRYYLILHLGQFNLFCYFTFNYRSKIGIFKKNEVITMIIYKKSSEASGVFAAIIYQNVFPRLYRFYIVYTGREGYTRPTCR